MNIFASTNIACSYANRIAILDHCFSRSNGAKSYLVSRSNIAQGSDLFLNRLSRLKRLKRDRNIVGRMNAKYLHGPGNLGYCEQSQVVTTESESVQ
jgi:hypothetical protein